MPLQSSKHIKGLDGLRGVAILLVFFFHYLPRTRSNPLFAFASLGWTGVDLFFVLSGFLITGILYDTRASSNFFKTFYARRALRIFPIYFLAVGVVCTVMATIGKPYTWKMIPFYFFGANVMLGLDRGVPDFTPYLQCIHFWSLALEEQFYAVWPLAVFFVRKRSTLMGICAGGIICALVFRCILTHLGVNPWILYTELPSRMDSLFAGALLALTLRGPNPAAFLSTRKLYLLMGACCVGLLTLVFRARSLFLTSPEMTSFGYTLIAGLYVSILGLTLVPGTFVNRAGSNRTLRFFGKYSYGLYLWHDLPSPICVGWIPWFYRNVHPLIPAQFVYALTMLALFTTIAVISYHTVEAKFLKLKIHFQYLGSDWPS